MPRRGVTFLSVGRLKWTIGQTYLPRVLTDRHSIMSISYYSISMKVANKVVIQAHKSLFYRRSISIEALLNVLLHENLDVATLKGSEFFLLLFARGVK